MTPHTKIRQLIIATTLALASASSHALIAWAEPSANIVDSVTGSASSWNYSYTVTNTTDCYLTCDAGTWYGAGNELVGIERGHRNHRQNLA